MASRFFASFLDELEARTEIEDCLKRFARAVDRQDWALARTLYHDGAFDDRIHAVALLTDSDAATVYGAIAWSALGAELRERFPEVDAEGAALRVDLVLEPDALAGRLSVDADGVDERLIASF